MCDDSFEILSTWKSSWYCGYIEAVGQDGTNDSLEVALSFVKKKSSLHRRGIAAFALASVLYDYVELYLLSP